jgi:hypothetical protein
MPYVEGTCSVCGGSGQKPGYDYSQDEGRKNSNSLCMHCGGTGKCKCGSCGVYRDRD